MKRMPQRQVRAPVFRIFRMFFGILAPSFTSCISQWFIYPKSESPPITLMVRQITRMPLKQKRALVERMPRRQVRAPAFRIPQVQKRVPVDRIFLNDILMLF
jgi:hypothetical protein